MLRNYSNTVEPTSLSAPLNNSAATFDVASTAGFPAVPFIAAIDRGTADEEVVLVTAKTSTTVTVSRGYDGTAAVAHLSGAAFEHTTAAIESREPNEHINDTERDDHTQYFNLDRAKVYFPTVIDGSSPVAVSTVDTTYRQCNTLTIPSATFSRKVRLHGVVSVLASSGAFYRARIQRSGTAYGGAYYLAPGSSYMTLHMMSDWLTLASGTAYTFTTQIKRDSGSGGTTDDDPNFNKISALVVPNV